MAGVMAKRAISTVSVTEEIPAAVRMVRPSAARRAVSRLTVFSASVAGMIVAAAAAAGADRIDCPNGSPELCCRFR